MVENIIEQQQVLKESPTTGRIKPVIIYGILLIVSTVLAFAIASKGLIMLAVLIGLPFGLTFIFLIIARPHYGLFVAVFLGFVAIGITRYVPAPLGLSIDAILFLTLLGTIISIKKMDAYNAQNSVVAVIFAWFVFTILEIFNPEAPSVEAWFYAARGLSFYMMFTVPLAFILLKKREYLTLFLHIWLLWSVVGALYGMKQLYIGLDHFEQAWLDAGNIKTHILHGRLRVFSFYSDAGQFGASQAHTMLIALILAIGTFSFKRRLFYFIAAAICFWGMAISGTRGAIFVPLFGILTYLVLSKRFAVLVIGLAILASCFFILKFTFIGQSNYQIQRMRSALDPNDASFQVRLENQKKLSTYLKSRPIGGGVGSAGYWGLRFKPTSFLAQTPTDSWYVKIWAETGVVGLVVHVSMLLFIIITGFFQVFYLKDPQLRQQALAIYSGVVGIAIASYGNQVLGQMPTGILIYISIAFIFMVKDFEKKEETVA